MSATPLAPNNVYYSAYYKGSGGSWTRIAMHSIDVPQAAMMPEKGEQVLNGDVQGAVVTKRPLPTGSIVVSDIQATATSYTLRDAVLGINGGSAVTPVNAAITRTVPSECRLFDMKVVCNAQEIGGQSFYDIFTGVEFQIPATAAGADTGNTMTIPIMVWGTCTRTNL